MTLDDFAKPREDSPSHERKTPMADCPMAASCRRMSEARFPRILLPLPGLLFIALGVLILLFPALLVWLIALVCIGMGVLMLVVSSLMGRVIQQMQRMHN